MGTERTEKRSIIPKMRRFVHGENTKKKKQNLGENRVSEATHAITRLFFFSLPLLFLSREQGGEWGIAFQCSVMQPWSFLKSHSISQR